MEQNKRNLKITVRVSAEEKDTILQNMKRANIPILEVYIRKMVIDGKIIRVDMTVLRDLATNLRRCGVLLNQLVKRSIQDKQVYPSDIVALREMFEGVAVDVESLLKRISRL